MSQGFIELMDREPAYFKFVAPAAETAALLPHIWADYAMAMLLHASFGSSKVYLRALVLDVKFLHYLMCCSNQVMYSVPVTTAQRVDDFDKR